MAGNGFKFSQDLSFRLSSLKFTIKEYEKHVTFRIEICHKLCLVIKERNCIFFIF